MFRIVAQTSGKQDLVRRRYREGKAFFLKIMTEKEGNKMTKGKSILKYAM